MPRITRILPRRQGSWLELHFLGGAGAAQTPGGGLRLPVDKLPPWAGAGAELSWEQYRELEQLSEYELLLERALRLLGRREHFSAELREKLGQPRPSLRQRDALAAEGRGREESGSPDVTGNARRAAAQPTRKAGRELVERVLATCREHGYLNDHRAAVYLITLLAGRGDLGRRKVREELLRRGCAAAMADELLEEHAGEFDDRAAMAELLRRKRRSLEGRARRLREKLQKQIDEQNEDTESQHAEHTDDGEGGEESAHVSGASEHKDQDANEGLLEITATEIAETSSDDPVPDSASRGVSPKPRTAGPKSLKMRRLRKDDRWLRYELRGRLSAAVFTLLATRGFGGDEAKRAAMSLVEELVDL